MGHSDRCRQRLFWIVVFRDTLSKAFTVSSLAETEVEKMSLASEKPGDTTQFLGGETQRM